MNVLSLSRVTVLSSSQYVSLVEIVVLCYTLSGLGNSFILLFPSSSILKPIKYRYLSPDQVT
jgi:hypothetical protein